VIGLSRGLSVFAFTESVDMRKSFNTLSALVVEQMKRELLTGDLFLFVSQDRKRAKVLYFDGTGLCLWSKRLEKGKFAALWKRKRDGGLELTLSELSLFIEGSDSIGRVPLSPALLTHADLRSKMHPDAM
jgi:transposase